MRALRMLLPLLLLLAAVTVQAGDIHPKLAEWLELAPPDEPISVIVNMTEQAPITALNEELKARRVDKASGSVDEDEIEAAEGFELPGADLSNEELSVRVLPRQADEFTCSRCFLVHHRSQLAKEVGGQPVCKECAA